MTASIMETHLLIGLGVTARLIAAAGWLVWRSNQQKEAAPDATNIEDGKKDKSTYQNNSTYNRGLQGGGDDE